MRLGYSCLYAGVLCVYGFFHGTHLRSMQHEIDDLQDSLDQMRSRVTDLTATNSRHRLLIESKNDPATVELMLMENLGLVPKGARKVYFKK